MKFTQFVFPAGRQREEHINMAPDIEALAAELAAAGWRFEIECHPDTQMVNMDCCDDEEPIAVELVANGPGVPAAVEKLVRDAHAAWIASGKPAASRTE